MMTGCISAFAGFLFGIGLLVSGMSNPAKVLAFLDIGGRWDPSLALVMLGAIAVAFVPFRIAQRKRVALNGDPVRLPAAAPIDLPLVIGGLVFGIGWGLAGFCPGPALVAAAAGQLKAMAFVIAMLCGMAIYKRTS